MTMTDAQYDELLAQIDRHGKKPVERMAPDKPLGKPVRSFASTFSAVTVLMGMFFTKKPKEFKMHCTVKAERRVIPPPPPKEEVCITMSPEEAILLRNDLRSAAKESSSQRFGINRVLNALAQLNLPD